MHAPHSERVNMGFNGAYLCLLYGAVLRLVTPFLLDVDSSAGAAVDYVHWSGVPLLFIVGYSFKYAITKCYDVQHDESSYILYSSPSPSDLASPASFDLVFAIIS